MSVLKLLSSMFMNFIYGIGFLIVVLTAFALIGGVFGGVAWFDSHFPMIFLILCIVVIASIVVEPVRKVFTSE